MKKLTLILVALFTTSLMFSQAGPGGNSGDLNGNGDPKDCLGCHIDQVDPIETHGVIIENTEYINQLGDNNHASVYQTGQANYANIYQFNDNNHSKVNQFGVGNVIYVDQQGYQNHGKIDQTGVGNYAYQKVGVGFAEHNKANITQTGYINRAFQFQYYDRNEATIIQNNDEDKGEKYNYAYQMQNTGTHGEGVKGSVAYINQDGQKNAASQEQTGSNNDAYATQIGFHNRSVEVQVSLAGGDLINKSIVYQNGKNNKSCVYQTANDFNNFSSVTQNGDNNHAKVKQVGGETSWVVSHGGNGGHH